MMTLSPGYPLKAGMQPDAGEVDLAGEVQRLLLPKSSPLCSWCCMAVKNRMASVLGGDFYDFIELEDGCQAMFLGDVTGHGVHASVVMSMVYGFLHRAIQEGCDPCRVMRDLNAFLRTFAARSERLDYFFSATLFLGVIDPGTLRMDYINAGHPAGMVRRGEKILRLPATSHPVGYFDQPEYLLRSCILERGDRLLLITDGVADSMNWKGETYGLQRLENSLRERETAPEDFLNELFTDLDRFLADRQALDDQTAIVVDLHQLR